MMTLTPGPFSQILQDEARWGAYLERYRRGEWRAPIFRDMILEDARAMGPDLTFVDIGCGRGFDHSVPLQEQLAAACAQYIGVEPDAQIPAPQHVTTLHRTFFEDAPIPSGSVHIAFAVMVLEHLTDPRRFWDKVHDVLADGGVFWAFTVDARHWFSRISMLMQKLRLKDLYLDRLMGSAGSERYENYPTYYRSNTPEDLRRLAAGFRSLDMINFSRVGQCSDYFPRPVHPMVRLYDRRAIARGRPGTLLAIRVAK